MNADDLQTVLAIHGLHVVNVSDELIPDWWFEELETAIARLPRTGAKDRSGPGRPRDLVEKLVPKHLHGDARADAINKVQVKVHRFLTRKNRTLETAEEFRRALGLPRFFFVAVDETATRALTLAEADPVGTLEALAIKQRIRDEVASRVSAIPSITPDSARNVTPASSDVASYAAEDKAISDERIAREVRPRFDLIKAKARAGAPSGQSGTVRSIDGGGSGKRKPRRAGGTRARTQGQ